MIFFNFPWKNHSRLFTFFRSRAYVTSLIFINIRNIYDWHAGIKILGKANHNSLVLRITLPCGLVRRSTRMHSFHRELEVQYTKYQPQRGSCCMPASGTEQLHWVFHWLMPVMSQRRRWTLALEDGQSTPSKYKISFLENVPK